MGNPASIPLWLRRILLKQEDPEPGRLWSSTVETEVFCAAMEDVSQEDLKSRFDLSTKDILACCRRIRDAIRRSDAPQRIKEDYPWLTEWVNNPKRNKIQRKSNGHVVPPVSSEIQTAIERITDQPYPEVSLDDPKGMPNFLAEVKARFAAVAGPLALRRTSEAVAEGAPWAIQSTRDFLYGRPGGGPLVALQQNFAGPEGEAVNASAGQFRFAPEKVILEYEKDHPDELVGESTTFGDHLLELQDNQDEGKE